MLGVVIASSVFTHKVKPSGGIAIGIAIAIGIEIGCTLPTDRMHLTNPATHPANSVSGVTARRSR